MSSQSLQSQNRVIWPRICQPRGIQVASNWKILILDNVKDVLLVSGYEASKPNSGLPDSCLGYFYSSEASNSFQRLSCLIPWHTFWWSLQVFLRLYVILKWSLNLFNYGGMHMPQCTCEDKRTDFWSWFSLLGGFQRWNSGCRLGSKHLDLLGHLNGLCDHFQAYWNKQKLTKNEVGT